MNGRQRPSNSRCKQPSPLLLSREECTLPLVTSGAAGPAPPWLRPLRGRSSHDYRLHRYEGAPVPHFGRESPAGPPGRVSPRLVPGKAATHPCDRFKERNLEPGRIRQSCRLSASTGTVPKLRRRVGRKGVVSCGNVAAKSRNVARKIRRCSRRDASLIINGRPRRKVARSQDERVPRSSLSQVSICIRLTGST